MIPTLCIQEACQPFWFRHTHVGGIAAWMRRQSLHQDWGTVQVVESNEDPNRVSRQTPVNQPVEPIIPDVVVKPSTQETALALLQAMRPQQWTKNGLVFAALVFDR